MMTVADAFDTSSGRAVLITDGELESKLDCVYTVNISRSGIAFLHAVQLFPLEKFRIALPDGRVAEIMIRRCRRIGDRCYECGAMFSTAMDEAAEIRPAQT